MKRQAMVPKPEPEDLRSRKRLANRQTISNVATRLFLERGFDAVTIDEIAKAADVGRMTVFNHFPRKEDMFFDREEEARALIRDALEAREPRVGPVETLRRLAHRLVEEESPLVRFTAGSRGFVETIEGSESLKARARAIRDELAEVAAVALAESVGRDPGEPIARLTGSLLLATWTMALVDGYRTFRKSRNKDSARAAFLAMIDRGTLGLKAIVAGTPYA